MYSGLDCVNSNFIDLFSDDVNRIIGTVVVQSPVEVLEVDISVWHSATIPILKVTKVEVFYLACSVVVPADNRWRCNEFVI